jgi:serine/threonine-protein kinase
VYLEVAPPRCRLRDLSSTNPPRVNGEPISECELRDGDVIDLGRTQLRIAIVEDAPELEPSVDLPPVPAVTPAAQAPIAPRCAYCDTDLTIVADLDGRAAELADAALYACARHFEAEIADDTTRVGPYVAVRRLGEGSMGTVSLVHHPVTARLWALKRIHDLGNPTLVKRFAREVRLMQQIVHPHVLRCVDTGVDTDGRPYVVTEYAPDGALEDLMRRRGGPLAPGEAVPLVRGILAGVEHLHALGIVHRDIKPSNILLRRGVAKLGDFGIAKSYARAGGTSYTHPGTRLGTLMFMPPEQIRDAAGVREPADLYAVGVTLYYLLTGHFSFDFPSPAEAAAGAQGWQDVDAALDALLRHRRARHPFFVILEQEPIPIRDRAPALPPFLAAVVDRAVRKEPVDRFESAAAFGAALEGIA